MPLSTVVVAISFYNKTIQYPRSWTRECKGCWRKSYYWKVSASIHVYFSSPFSNFSEQKKVRGLTFFLQPEKSRGGNFICNISSLTPPARSCKSFLNTYQLTTCQFFLFNVIRSARTPGVYIAKLWTSQKIPVHYFLVWHHLASLL